MPCITQMATSDQVVGAIYKQDINIVCVLYLLHWKKGSDHPQHNFYKWRILCKFIQGIFTQKQHALHTSIEILIVSRAFYCSLLVFRRLQCNSCGRQVSCKWSFTAHSSKTFTVEGNTSYWHIQSNKRVQLHQRINYQNRTILQDRIFGHILQCLPMPFVTVCVHMYCRLSQKT